MRPRRPAPDAVWHHPVDDLEPEADSLSDAADMLSAFLRAVAEQQSCCGAGLEAMAHIALAMPAQFPGGFAEPTSRLPGDYRALGRAFARLFSCIAGGWTRTRISEAGIRALAAVYVLRPDLLGGATMHALGARCGGVTRQAFCKHVRAIRDSHGGIRNRAMKSESARQNFRERCIQTWKTRHQPN
jgi:hypothetical protein